MSTKITPAIAGRRNTMTEPKDFETTPGGDLPPASDAADEPAPEGQWTGGDAGSGAGSDTSGASARGREWMGQLETMIQEITTQATPVARQIGAKAAELAAVAATKAGPFAQKAADVTSDVSQRFAERAQSVAADLRAEPGTATNGHTAEPAPAPTPEDPTAPPPA
jgi:hypothetical protein